MEKEEFLQKLQDIGTSEDMTNVRSIVADLTETVNTLYDDKSNLENLKSNNEAEIEKLRAENMKLFLRVTDNNTDNNNNINNEEDDKQPRKFEDLFDEKGMIK